MARWMKTTCQATVAAIATVYQEGLAQLIQGQNRVWGVGPEFTRALASKSRKAIYGFVTVRYHWELGARTTTEGGAWNVVATFPLKPIRLP